MRCFSNGNGFLVETLLLGKEKRPVRFIAKEAGCHEWPAGRLGHRLPRKRPAAWPWPRQARATRALGGRMGKIWQTDRKRPAAADSSI